MEIRTSAATPHARPERHGDCFLPSWSYSHESFTRSTPLQLPQSFRELGYRVLRPAELVLGNVQNLSSTASDRPDL
jgi:hypothetical protein